MTASPRHSIEPVFESWRRDRPIRWQRVHDLPDFVYFNHSIHVNKGVGCVECHGRVDQMPQTHQVAPLQMRWCLDCHRDTQRVLRPAREIFNLAWTPPEDQTEQGARLAALYDTPNEQVLTSCSTCHR